MEKGLKYDNDKLRWDLLPIQCTEDIVRVLTFGSKKYADNNWQLVEKAGERYYAAVLRHLAAWRQGEITDPESGLPHLAHIACNITFLQWIEKERNKSIHTQKSLEIVSTTSPTIALPHAETTTSAPNVENGYTKTI
jgi:hypothetical protein